MTPDREGAGMPDDDDDIPSTAAAPDVGVIWGIVMSERSNFRRHERWVGEKFNSFETKIDRVNDSLKEIKELLDNKAGQTSAWIAMSKPVLVLWGAAISGVVSLALHFWFKATQ